METRDALKISFRILELGDKTGIIMKDMIVDKSIFKRIQENLELILLLFLVILGWSIRVYFAINTGGQVHADEIFQSLEVAHKLKYGYGDTPWEFRVVGLGDEGSLRSYLFPLIFYVIFEICDLGGIPYGSEGILKVVRIFSATWSTLLILIMFFLTKELLPNQDKYSSFSLFAAFLTAVWFEFPYYGIRTITNSFVTILIFLGIYFHILANKSEVLTPKMKRLEICAGMLFGFACALRMDSFAFFIPFLFLRHQNSKKMIQLYSFLLLGFLESFFIQGISDLFFYDTFLISPFQWVLFSAIQGKSAQFGVSPREYYLQHLNEQPFYLFVFAITLGVLALKVQTTLTKKEKIPDSGILAILMPLIWFLISLGSFSLIQHKEHRFIFSLYPILMIIFAATIKECFEIFKDIISFLNSEILPKVNIKRRIRKTELGIIQGLILLVLCLFVIQTSAIAANEREWSDWDSLFRALEWVGNQKNSTGVIIFENGWVAGGRTYLHKEIPMGCFAHPVEDQNWTNLSISYNYLICPQFQYQHENLEYQISIKFTKIKTTVIQGHSEVDIWYLKEINFL